METDLEKQIKHIMCINQVHGYKSVSAIGRQNAEIAFVGEAPTDNEGKAGILFVGASGYHLDRCLRLAGIDRDKVYITNLCKRQAPGNRLSKVLYKEMQDWNDLLIEELNSLKNLKVIIPLGNYALKAITERSGITNFRGSVMHPIKDIETARVAIPTFHPSVLNNSYESWPLIVADLIKIVKILEDFDNFKFPEYNFIIKPTLETVLNKLKWLEDQDFPLVTLDIETPYGILSAIGIGWNRSDAICIPFIWGDRSNYWTEAEEVILWQELARVLPKLNIGNQNMFFDKEKLLEYGIQLKPHVYDPMLMHHCLYSSLPHTLDAITSIYTNIQYYKKDERDTSEGVVKGSSLMAGKEIDHWTYNALDCCAAYWCIEELEKELKEDNMWDVYKRLYVNIFEPIFKMNVNGIRISVDELVAHRKEQNQLMEETHEILNEEAGYKINPKSPKQVRDLLVNKMKMEPYKKRVKDSKTKEVKYVESMCEENLIKMATKYNTRVPLHIIEIRKIAKELTLFSDENTEGGRVKTQFALHRTDTGRFSSRKSFSGHGMNIQNIKRGNARRFFVPEPGEIMLKCDQKQAEARVVAWLTKDTRMIEAAESGEFHIRNAVNMYSRDLSSKEKIDKYKKTEEYIHVKACGHGGNYGMGALEFARHSKMPLDKAKKVHGLYHNTYPGIEKEFHKMVENAVDTTRTLVNPFGRRAIFFGRQKDRSTYKSAYSFIPQSTITDVNKIALSCIWQYLNVLLDAHDGLNMSIPQSIQKEACLLTIWAYKKARFQIYGIWHEIPIEIGIGPNWRDTEEIETNQYEKQIDGWIKNEVDVPKELAL